jgi:hypothetical protein
MRWRRRRRLGLRRLLASGGSDVAVEIALDGRGAAAVAVLLPGHRAALGGKSAADREGGVAVRHQRGDEQLASHLAELEDLEPANDQVAFAIWLVDGEGRLPVAGAGPQVHRVRACGCEDGVPDERRHRLPAVEPRGERGHDEADVFGDEPDESVDVRELPGLDITLQELLHSGFGNVGLRKASMCPDRLAGPRQQAVDRCGADLEHLGTGLGSSAAGYDQLESDISQALAASQQTFRSGADSGAGAFGPLESVVIAAALLIAACSAWGLSRRIAEYR